MQTYECYGPTCKPFTCRPEDAGKALEYPFDRVSNFTAQEEEYTVSNILKAGWTKTKEGNYICPKCTSYRAND